MFISVCIPFIFVTGDVEGVLWWMFNFFTSVRPNLKILCARVQSSITLKKINNPKHSIPTVFHILFVVKEVAE